MTVYEIMRQLRDTFFCILTDISPELNTRVRYRHYYKRRLDLSNPTSFSEKLLWLKLKRYANDPLVKKCADKYAVRQYITDNGYADILVPLIGVYDSPQEIDFDKLPEKFALKWSFGCGYNIICNDKRELDVQQTIKQLDSWGRIKYYKFYAEMQYKDVEHKIICEEFLPGDSETGVIPDYKVYCFNGKPEVIFVMHDRGHGVKSEFFDIDWNRLENSNKYTQPTTPTPKPACLDFLLEVAGKISQPFPFVRCDFYILNGKLYFGEMTFTPAGGLYTSQTKVHGKEMADLLDISLQDLHDKLYNDGKNPPDLIVIDSTEKQSASRA